MVEEIYALAVSYMEPGWDTELLERYCGCALSQWSSQLKSGVCLEDCQDNLVIAAAWLAVDLYSQAKSADGIASFTAGDFSVTRKEHQGLRQQAEQLMAPYVWGRMGFLGVPS